jgi:hypothetical protein
MFHAGMRASESEILRKHEELNFQEAGVRHSLTHTSDGVTYSVSDGEKKDAATAVWAFGTGEIGQTYMLEKQGAYFESRLSYFTSLSSLDVTPGQSTEAPQGIEHALGNRLDVGAVRHCFSCHTTAAVTAGKFESEKAIPGVQCEACHGPGARHVGAMEAQQNGKDSATIMNPAHLSPADSVDFCGACHRTWADVALEMPANIGVASVRFQPYRLEKSRCWGKNGDARITCLACHDPHQPLVTELSAYDSKCLACHTTKPGPKGQVAAKTACKVGTSNCASCHMPKYEAPQTHAQFTDHYIRVVRTTGQGSWLR